MLFDYQTIERWSPNNWNFPWNSILAQEKGWTTSDIHGEAYHRNRFHIVPQLVRLRGRRDQTPYKNGSVISGSTFWSWVAMQTMCPVFKTKAHLRTWWYIFGVPFPSVVILKKSPLLLVNSREGKWRPMAQCTVKEWQLSALSYSGWNKRLNTPSKA